MSTFHSLTDSNEILRKMMHELRFLVQHIDVAEISLREKCIKYVRFEEAQLKLIEEDLIKQRQTFEEEKIKQASESARSRVVDQERLKKAGEDSKKIIENGKLKEKQACLQSELSTLRVKVSELNKEKSAFENSSNENHRHMLKAKNDLSRSEREKADLRVQLSVLKSTNSQLEEQLNKAKKSTRKYEPLKKTVISDQTIQQLQLNKENIDNTANNLTKQMDNFSYFNSNQIYYQPMNFDQNNSNKGFMLNQPASAPPRIQWANPLFHYAPSLNSSAESTRTLVNNSINCNMPSPEMNQRIFQQDSEIKWPLKMDMKYVETKRSDTGLSHFYSNGERTFFYTKLKCHCTVYCYDNIDYVWHYRKPEKIKVFYSGNGKAFQLDTPDNWNIRIFSTGHFEIHRPTQEDVSTIQTNNKRIEMISHFSETPTFEIFESNEIAYKLEVNGSKTFIDAKQSKSVRRDGSSVQVLPNGVEYQSKDKDFAIHRHVSGFIRVYFKLFKLELSFCTTDLFFMARHISEKDGKELKLQCFKRGNCIHVNQSH